MSTLQVANLHVEATGNNRIQYIDGKLAVVAGGSNVVVGNSTQYSIYAGGIETLASNTSTLYFLAGNAVVVSANSSATSFYGGNSVAFVANSSSVLAQNIIFGGSVKEYCNVTATAATGTINFYTNDNSIQMRTANATANWTLNIAANSTVTLNNRMSAGETMTVVLMVPNGPTAYFSNTLQIDGVTQTPYWGGGVFPSAGTPNAYDVYTYTITKTGTSAYVVMANIDTYGG